MYQGQYPMVGNFHLEVFQKLYDCAGAVSETQARELQDLAVAGLKDDMKLLADQRKGFRKSMEEAEALRKRIEACPNCGRLLEKTAHDPPCCEEEQDIALDPETGESINLQNIPCTKEAAEAQLLVRIDEKKADGPMQEIENEAL